MRVRGDDVARFWSYVEKGPDCWFWVGSRDGSGYGKFRVGSKQVGAHRYAYERTVGPVRAGIQIAHLCGTRHCVNPAHLDAVTPSERFHRIWVKAGTG